MKYLVDDAMISRTEVKKDVDVLEPVIGNEIAGRGF